MEFKRLLEIDISLNPWVHNIPTETFSVELNNILCFGHKLINMAKVSLDNPLKPILQDLKESTVSTQNRMIEKMTHMMEKYDNDSERREQSMEELNSSIHKITGKSICSSTRGDIGENFIYNTLIDFFPNALIEIKAATKRESDIHIDLNDGETPLILIESKLYSKAVQYKEVEKFHRDLERHATNYGIFISLTSNISKKKRFEYEDNGKCSIFYVANTDFNKLSVIYPILFIKEIHKLKMTSKTLCNQLDNDLSSKCIENRYIEIYNKIANSTDDFTKIIDRLNEFKQDSLESIGAIRKELDKIQSQIITTDVSIKSIIYKISETIGSQLKDIVNVSDLEDRILDNIELTKIVEQCVINKYNLTMEFEQIVLAFMDKGYSFIQTEGKCSFKCIKTPECYCVIKMTKNKISLHFVNSLKKHNLKYDIHRENFNMFRCLFEQME